MGTRAGTGALEANLGDTGVTYQCPLVAEQYGTRVCGGAASRGSLVESITGQHFRGEPVIVLIDSRWWSTLGRAALMTRTSRG